MLIEYLSQLIQWLFLWWQSAYEHDFMVEIPLFSTLPCTNVEPVLWERMTGAKALLLLAAAIIFAGEKLKMPGVLPLLVNGDRVEHEEITVETTLIF